MSNARCRLCGEELRHVFADLGVSPLANGYLKPEQLYEAEKFYPLRAYVCERDFLVQLEECEPPSRIFSDYAYFSSYSSTWLRHVEKYVDDVIERFALRRDRPIIEIASNDGYLLQFFQRRGFKVLGIEPAANVAEAARAKGIPTLTRFFGADTARDLRAQGRRAKLLIGNNVLAHVPDLHGFVAGMKILLAADGIFTMEFHHLLSLVRGHQFDTIYHEHFSYLSLLAVERLFAAHDLALFDVEELPTHGGSLRVYGKHAQAPSPHRTARIERLRDKEQAAGLNDLKTYLAFGERVKETKRRLLRSLIEIKERGGRIVAYGAPAKGNTLLNYCGIGRDFVEYAVDVSPHKQGLFLPGTRLAIKDPEAIRETRPDYLLILPWNIKEEVMAQMSWIGEWGGKFIVPMPEVSVISADCPQESVCARASRLSSRGEDHGSRSQGAA